jgi:2-polyprenyl-3-methyl-5-hydroxy-6-metoxy-1,4-benzoquinol methylase
MNKDFKAFPNHYINAIDENPDKNYFTPILNDIFKLISHPSSVCDVGCGNGRFTISSKKKYNFHLVGYDGSEYALSEAKRIGYDDVHLVPDFSTDKLPAKSDAFELVLCKDVLEHLLDPDHLLCEISRITKVNGYCLFHVPNHFPLIARIGLIFKNNIDTFNYFPNSERWNFPHIRFFNMESLIRLAKKNGLTLVSNLSWYFLLPSVLRRKLPFIARMIGINFTDASCEGYTLLFKKQ